MESVFPNRDTYEFVLYFSGVFFFTSVLCEASLSHSYREPIHNMKWKYLFICDSPLLRCSEYWKFLTRAFEARFSLGMRTFAIISMQIAAEDTERVYEDDLISRTLFFPSQNWTYFLFTLLFSCCLVSIRMYRSFNMSCRVLIFCTQDSSPT